MATTPILGLTLPTDGSEAWGDEANENFTEIDTAIGTLRQAVAAVTAPPVQSVFGRIGAVTAEEGDYSFSDIEGSVTVEQLPSIPTTKLTGVLAIDNGGTGAADAADSRANLGAAGSGVNSDITSLTALTSLKLSGSQAMTGVQGSTGTKLAVTTGTFVPGNLRATDSNGNEIDSGISAVSIPGSAPVQSVNGNIGAVVTVSTVSVVGEDGVTANVLNPATTPSITIGLTDITPTTLSVGGSQAITGVQGTTGTALAVTSGTFTDGHLRSTDANGNEIDSGVEVSAIASAASVASSAQATAIAAQPSAAKGQPNGYASLDANGMLPSAQLPPLAIDHTYVVASQAAMLALAANVGDIAIRSDINNTFILQALPATTLGNWQQLLIPSSPVQSVNGQVGVVDLTAADVDAASLAANNFTGVQTAPAFSGSLTLPNSLATSTTASSFTGTGTQIATVSGGTTLNDFLVVGPNGNLVDSGVKVSDAGRLSQNQSWPGINTFSKTVFGTSSTITGVQGNGTMLAATSGVFITGNLRITGANGNEVDAGLATANIPTLNGTNSFSGQQFITVAGTTQSNPLYLVQPGLVNGSLSMTMGTVNVATNPANAQFNAAVFGFSNFGGPASPSNSAFFGVFSSFSASIDGTGVFNVPLLTVGNNRSNVVGSIMGGGPSLVSMLGPLTIGNLTSWGSTGLTDSGVSATNVPLLNGSNVFTGPQTFSAAGVVIPDTVNGHTYRLQVTNGAIALTQVS